jgi:hypothetical protein
VGMLLRATCQRETRPRQPEDGDRAAQGHLVRS